MFIKLLRRPSGTTDDDNMVVQCTYTRSPTVSINGVYSHICNFKTKNDSIQPPPPICPGWVFTLIKQSVDLLCSENTGKMHYYFCVCKGISNSVILTNNSIKFVSLLMKIFNRKRINFLNKFIYSIYHCPRLFRFLCIFPPVATHYTVYIHIYNVQYIGQRLHPGFAVAVDSSIPAGCGGDGGGGGGGGCEGGTCVTKTLSKDRPQLEPSIQSK